MSRGHHPDAGGADTAHLLIEDGCLDYRVRAAVSYEHGFAQPREKIVVVDHTREQWLFIGVLPARRVTPPSALHNLRRAELERMPPGRDGLHERPHLEPRLQTKRFDGLSRDSG